VFEALLGDMRMWRALHIGSTFVSIFAVASVHCLGPPKIRKEERRTTCPIGVPSKKDEADGRVYVVGGF
jgi:hypothetical protein